MHCVYISVNILSNVVFVGRERRLCTTRECSLKQKFWIFRGSAVSIEHNIVCFLWLVLCVHIQHIQCACNASIYLIRHVLVLKNSLRFVSHIFYRAILSWVQICAMYPYFLCWKIRLLNLLTNYALYNYAHYQNWYEHSSETVVMNAFFWCSEHHSLFVIVVRGITLYPHPCSHCFSDNCRARRRCEFTFYYSKILSYVNCSFSAVRRSHTLNCSNDTTAYICLSRLYGSSAGGCRETHWAASKRIRTRTSHVRIQ